MLFCKIRVFCSAEGESDISVQNPFLQKEYIDDMADTYIS